MIIPRGVASFARLGGGAKFKSGGQRSSPKSEGFFWPKSQIFFPKTGDLEKKKVFAEIRVFFWPKLQVLTFFPPKNINFFLPKKFRGGARKKAGGARRKIGGALPPPPASDAPDHTHSISSGVIKTDLTEHFPILCTISNVTVKKSHKPIFRRDFSMFNADDFRNHLSTEINSFFLTISYIDGNNFDDIFNQFLQLLTNATTLHAPIRKLTRKQKKLKNKPWVGRCILKSIKTKQKMYLSHFGKGNLEQKQLYKKYANKLTKVKFAAKKLYYQDKLETSKNNTSEV